ncbi:MAG TPA: superoxide dismutase [Myxococcota bacterium]|nr:superoxide dismutase [Myxococcota bacterium]
MKPLIMLPLLALSFACASTSGATPPPPTPVGHTLAPLPYAYDALEPAIDKQTMEIHHGRHHKAYVDNLNAALADKPELAKLPLFELMKEAGKHGAAIRNNGGGHYNHMLFWQLMAPVGKGGTPSAALVKALDRDLGGMDNFKKAFAEAGAKRFGSGWAWLVVTADKTLAVTSTPNQDNPLMDVAEVKGMPILALDVWEHAYYLKYMNKRGDYIGAWWTIVNWNEVNKRFDAAMR